MQHPLSGKKVVEQNANLFACALSLPMIEDTSGGTAAAAALLFLHRRAPYRATAHAHFTTRVHDHRLSNLPVRKQTRIIVFGRRDARNIESSTTTTTTENVHARAHTCWCFCHSSIRSFWSIVFQT